MDFKNNTIPRAWVIATLLLLLSLPACSPKIISKSGNIYRIKYHGKTYFTDSPKTIKEDL